ncbi:hypothetical protein TNCT_205011 [Trichonephila clavata]|uniref:Uncharacterized protein n=1 Tax=Trichonephila clavata TaxID=2740835 RepID=A0A8X6FUN4_TRICU|nr:hypothetical protein TNCT_205011 [Trichonephila clavata]
MHGELCVLSAGCRSGRGPPSRHGREPRNLAPMRPQNFFLPTAFPDWLAEAIESPPLGQGRDFEGFSNDLSPWNDGRLLAWQLKVVIYRMSKLRRKESAEKD